MSLLVWYPLQGDTLNRGTLGAELNPTASGATYAASILGSSLYQGSLTQTSAQAKKWIGSTVTIAMWVYIRSDGTWKNGAPFFCGSSTMNAPYNRKFSMFCYDGTTDGSAKTSLHCSWQHDESNGTYWGPVYKNFFELNKWVHLCIVQDAATETITVYRNGNEYTKVSISGLASMKISQIQDSVPFCPSIDYQQLCDIRIYDHALNALEVKELSRGLVVHYTFDDILAESTTNLITSPHNIKYVSGASDNNVSAAGLINVATTTSGTYTLSGEYNIAASDSATGPRITMLVMYEGESNWSSLGRAEVIRDGTWRTFTLTGVTNPSKTVAYCGAWIFDYSSAGSARSCYARNLQFELKDHPTPYTPTSRESMLYNEAETIQPDTISNIVLTKDSASGSYSLKCAGSTVIRHTPAGDGSNATASFWLKNFDTSGQMVVFADANSKLAFGPYTNYSCISCQSGLYSQVMTSEINKYWKNDEWNHVAVRKNANNEYSCFVNGNKVANTTGDHWTHDTYLSVGCRISGNVVGRQVTGLIDDFRLYHTYLTDNEIVALYKSKAYITDKSDIASGEFIEDKVDVKVTEKSTFECKEIYELPSYIETNGSIGYFDTQYIPTSDDYSIELDVRIKDFSNFDTLAGFMYTGTTAPRCGIHIYSSKYMFGANATTSATTPLPADDKGGERIILKARFKSGVQQLYRNGVLIAANTTSFSHGSNRASIWLLSRNNFTDSSSSSAAVNPTRVELYGAKIYEGTEEVRNYIPWYDDTLKINCLYETHANVAVVGQGVLHSAFDENKQAKFYNDGKISGRQIIEI